MNQLPPATSTPPVDAVPGFVSYAHVDHKYLKQFECALKPLLRNLSLDPWSDKRIKPGNDWRAAIAAALQQAQFAVLLVSQEFLASDFIYKQELLPLLRQAVSRKMPIFWIPIGHCSFEETLLEGFQAAFDPAKPLNDMRKPAREKAWKQIVERIKQQLAGLAPVQSSVASTLSAFRVVLLASERDLLETRQLLEAQLRTDLAMEVVDGSVAPRDCDATVLLMGRQWEDGALAARWLEAEPERRLLFLSDPDADWPPPRLVDGLAWAEMEDFRAEQSEALLFQHPSELTALVCDALAALRSRCRPEQGPDPSLSGAERAYLNHWAPIWSSGRTRAASFSSIEFFKPALYVPLDGVSSAFICDEQQRIVPRPKSKSKPQAREQLMDTASQRLALSRWASAAVMRLCVLRGSPGCGKTVFLTRFAAALAQLRLGASVDPECPLDPAELRTAEGLAPIPIMLEATRLAQLMSSPAALAAEILRELGAVSSRDLPELAAVEAGLQAGRFWLLLDALDEVSEEQRRKTLLQDLAELARTLPHCRLLLTTRPTRYTGTLMLGAPFQVIDLVALNQAQVAALCGRFCRLYPDSETRPGLLLETVTALDARLRRNGSEPLSDNALMLTCICTVFKRQRRLPEDRVALLDLLIEELCSARSAEDLKRGWRLGPKEKRRLLERLALNMQEHNLQQQAYDAVQDLVATELGQVEHARLEASLTWLVETGLIYEEAGADSQPYLRFSHRLLREYLAASALIGNLKMNELVDRLSIAGRLNDPGWLDVISLLPGVRYRKDLAQAFGQALQELAEREQSPRLWGMLTAALAENRALYDAKQLSAAAQATAKRYEISGASWNLSERLFVLEQLGRLGHPGQDPHSQDYWVHHPAASFTMGWNESPYDTDKPEHSVQLSEAFWLARTPVTNAAYRKFIEARGYERREFWCDEGWRWLNFNDQDFERWFRKLAEQYKEIKEEWRPYFRAGRAPMFWDVADFNGAAQPVVGVSWYEARAYCRWLDGQLRERSPGWLPGGSYAVSLPSEAQWEYGARGSEGRRYAWGTQPGPGPERCNFDSQVGKTTAVGAYPAGATPLTGLLDMTGNVWEWCLGVWNAAAYKQDPQVPGDQDPSLQTSRRALRGGAWVSQSQGLAASVRLWDWAGGRGGSGGFRCCLCGSPEHA